MEFQITQTAAIDELLTGYTYECRKCSTELTILSKGMNPPQVLLSLIEGHYRDAANKQYIPRSKSFQSCPVCKVSPAIYDFAYAVSIATLQPASPQSNDQSKRGGWMFWRRNSQS